MKMILMQGIPASGKSTYAKQYIKEHEDCVRICRDDLRLMFGQSFSHPIERMVKLTADTAVIEALKLGHDVIIDETNIIEKTITHWKEIAKHYGAEVEIKYMHISLEEALTRNACRTPNVSDDVVKYFYYMLNPTEKPTE